MVELGATTLLLKPHASPATCQPSLQSSLYRGVTAEINQVLGYLGEEMSLALRPC